MTPQLRGAIQTMQLPQGMSITSLMSGPHVTNSAHFAGRAADVSLPHTKAGWDFVVNAIRSRRFSKIGSTSDVVNNPQMQALAQQNGVELFLDEGTGSHVHLEVGP